MSTPAVQRWYESLQVLSRRAPPDLVRDVRDANFDHVGYSRIRHRELPVREAIDAIPGVLLRTQVLVAVVKRHAAALAAFRGTALPVFLDTL